MKISYLILFLFSVFDGLAQGQIVGDESVNIRKKQSSDSLFIEVSYDEASPVAAKLYYVIDKAGKSKAQVVTYTHRYRNNKIITQPYAVSFADSLVGELVTNEQRLLIKAESIQEYKLDWLDGSVWAITIHDEKGIRKYTYPELFEQPHNETIRKIQEVFTYLDSKYRIDEKRRQMKLGKGRYHNFGETIMGIE